MNMDGQDNGNIPFVAPDKTRLRLNSSGHLDGTVDGVEQLTELRARAAFPFRQPDEFIELRKEKNDLVGFIRRMSELDAESRVAVEHALRLQHFVPVIRQILSIQGKYGLFVWKAVTDRGAAEFATRGRRQHVEEVSLEEYIVTDTEGNRYRIPRVSGRTDFKRITPG